MGYHRVDFLINLGGSDEPLFVSFRSGLGIYQTARTLEIEYIGNLSAYWRQNFTKLVVLIKEMRRTYIATKSAHCIASENHVW